MSRVGWERAVGAVVVVAAATYVFLELRPDLLFRDTTPNGGDTGAHVWWPAFMRDHVFPKLRLSGWSPDWYAGFPVGHFYFPTAAVLITLLDLVIPYNVAFKLTTAIGPVLLPVAAYTFGRGIRAPFPAPPLMAASTLPFLFFNTDTREFSFHIMGGNLPSTLAGEFSFSLALALALFFLAALARAFDDRRRLWLPALLLGFTVVTHIIVGVFAAVGALVVWVAHRPRKSFPVAVAIAVTAFLISAIWVVPMVGRLAYANDMGWGKITQYQDYLLHSDLRWAVVLAGVGLVTGAATLRRSTLEVAAFVAVFAALFVVLPEGRLWNLRLLPFYQLSLLMLAAIGVAEAVNLVRALTETPAGRTWARAGVDDETGSRPAPPDPPPRSSATEAPVEHDRPAAPGRPGNDDRLARAGMLLAHAVAIVGVVAAIAYAHDTRGFIPSWVRWNNSGYEEKPAYDEYQRVIDTLDGLAVSDHQRLLWERLDSINNYGSDLALELIPYFTDGKIGSMEGLYFESATTTPFHFLTVSELAAEPSNPQRGLPYGTIENDFDRGVEHLRMLGVRFFLAGSDRAKEKANDHPGLRLVHEIGAPDEEPHVARWALYEVVGTSLVEPIRYEPVVLDGVRPSGWQDPAVDWFVDPVQFARPLAGGGPGSWARVSEDEAGEAPFQVLEPIEVSDVELGVDRVSFRVSEPGVPVLVKVSYFPNWKVEGAEGPWRATPNFMVVVPTDEHVELTFGRTSIDRLGIAMSLLGVVGLVGLARWRPRHTRRSEHVEIDDRVPS